MTNNFIYSEKDWLKFIKLVYKILILYLHYKKTLKKRQHLYKIIFIFRSLKPLAAMVVPYTQIAHIYKYLKMATYFLKLVEISV